MLGLPILYLKGMRLMMFQLSGFCCMRSTINEDVASSLLFPQIKPAHRRSANLEP